jgi:Uncharacterized protein, possibly involved in utilization of glycolate and propanediol
MEIKFELVQETIAQTIAVGLKRGFPLACALVDESGRTLGVVKHQDAAYIAPEFALGKARLASAFRTSTGLMFNRLQKDRPLYGANLAALNTQNGWVVVEGGAAIRMDAVQGESHAGRCIGAIGVAGSFPAQVDQDIADEMVAWLRERLA